MVWDGDGSVNSVEALEIVGVATYIPTGRTQRNVLGKPKKKRSWWRRLLGC
jgi:hypothetical protein